ncbi:speckle-type POZ protein-like [Schistocerca serialis cubense]|uniref:speckle-type POZ protein-like n=1 Tax=Schistocerca serialis cubense TaxID=2023355 RepID=UPI00214E4FAB|nr:speckle-type POZ protein-like [Schistocerca serialis cubense]
MSAVNEGLEATVADLGALLDAGEGAVVTLVAGETRLAAHRAVLGARSPVFAATFRHDTAEARRGKVVVRDVEGPALRQLLVYCYTGEAPQLASVAPQLLTAADKYGLTALKDRCEQQLVSQLDVDNAAAAAVLAVRHSCPGLTEAAVAFVREHSHRVMASQGWADAVLNSPCEVIEIHRLLADLPQESRYSQPNQPPKTASHLLPLHQRADMVARLPLPLMLRHHPQIFSSECMSQPPKTASHLLPLHQRADMVARLPLPLPLPLILRHRPQTPSLECVRWSKVVEGESEWEGRSRPNPPPPPRP